MQNMSMMSYIDMREMHFSTPRPFHHKILKLQCHENLILTPNFKKTHNLTVLNLVSFHYSNIFTSKVCGAFAMAFSISILI